MKSLNSREINLKFLNSLFKYSNNTIFSICNNTESNHIYINKLCALVKTLKNNHKKIELFININSINNMRKLLNIIDKYPYVMIHYLGFTFTYAEFIKFYYDLTKFLNSNGFSLLKSFIRFASIYLSLISVVLSDIPIKISMSFMGRYLYTL